MLSQKTESFKEYFIIEFTKEILRAMPSYREFLVMSRKEDLLQKTDELKKIRQENINKILSEKTAEEMQRVSALAEKGFLLPELRKIKKQIKKPVSAFTNIDFGKISPLLRDSSVRVIECSGSSESVIVEGIRGREVTNIFLSEDEISGIIKKFSIIAGIPEGQGVLKISVENIDFFAVISELIGSKFIITKMPYSNYSKPPIFSYVKK